MNPLTAEEYELRRLFSQIPLSSKQSTSLKSKKKKVIVISGPTAVGKTRLSLIVAQAVKGEIVSADSMQVYKGMNIGTAKIKPEEKMGVPHHLIDIRDLSEKFSVMEFCHEAHKVIREILSREKVPIVVGGTGFYLNGLIYGPPQGPASIPEVRKQLENEVNEKGISTLYTRLQKADPEYAKTITSSDRHKIVRALEIISLTNKKVSDFSKIRNEDILYDYRCFFLYASKEILYQNIEMRCDEMIAEGFIDEVKKLEKQGLRKNNNASQAIGYRQCLEFLKSEGTAENFEKFVADFKRASRRYAKRQFTWFKKEPNFRWLNVETLSFDRIAEIVLQDYELSF